MAVHGVRQVSGDSFGPWHEGVCDGCESGKPQRVRTVTGEWGTATVCGWHEDHTD